MDFILNLSENMTEIFTATLLPQLYHADMQIVKLVQNHLKPLEHTMLLLSEHFSAAKVMDTCVPLFGAFRHELMLQLVTLLACVNTLTSLIKWTMPANRPYWWVREFNDTNDLQQYPGTCETTGAFPSSHCAALMAFMYVIMSFDFSIFQRLTKWPWIFCAAIRLFLLLSVSVCIAVSRIFLIAQFPSHCLLTGLLVIGAVMVFERYAWSCYALNRLKAVLFTCGLSLLPVCVYFGMQRLDLDPHWSVRMAFKWCADPAQMRHEDSSIFILGRDLGYLMGVMFSMPLRESNNRKVILIKRFPLLIGLEMVNYYARLETPKTFGRVAFVAYEFLRNAMHSFTLLTVLPKFTTVPRQEKVVLKIYCKRK